MLFEGYEIPALPAGYDLNEPLLTPLHHWGVCGSRTYVSPFDGREVAYEYPHSSLWDRKTAAWMPCHCGLACDAPAPRIVPVADRPIGDDDAALVAEMVARDWRGND